MLVSMPNAFPQDSSDQSARPERHCAQRTQAVCCRGCWWKVCPARRREELRPEYTKPKVLEGEVLRTLTLDRKGEFFQWNMPVDGKKIRILPDFDMKNQDTWTRARNVMRKLAADQES